MKASVFDTYVPKKDGTTMHFDILVPVNTSEENVLAFGREYLYTKGQEGQPITARECRFCHIEEVTPPVRTEIEANGYFIIEMQGC